MHLHVVRAKGDNPAVTVDTSAELITMRTMGQSADDADAQLAGPVPRHVEISRHFRRRMRVGA